MRDLETVGVELMPGEVTSWFGAEAWAELSAHTLGELRNGGMLVFVGSNKNEYG
jgi:hypothetical protein